jgi:hypothetical protein
MRRQKQKPDESKLERTHIKNVTIVVAFDDDSIGVEVFVVEKHGFAGVAGVGMRVIEEKRGSFRAATRATDQKVVVFVFREFECIGVEKKIVIVDLRQRSGRSRGVCF